MKRLVQLIGERHGLKESGLTNEAPDKQTDAQSLQSESLDDEDGFVKTQDELDKIEELEKKVITVLKEYAAPSLRQIVAEVDGGSGNVQAEERSRWMPIFEILSSMKEREIVKVNAGPYQHALSQSWMYIVVNQDLYGAVIQVLRSNGSLTLIQLDDIIYPLTAMKSQRINIIRCLDKLIEQSLVTRTANREGLGDVFYYHMTNGGIVETHERDESSISDEKLADAKAYMLHMLMNHSNEWIQEPKLFETIKENFTGMEDETLKMLIMSLVNDNSVQAGYDRNAVIPTQQCYRYKKRELEGDDMENEKITDNVYSRCEIEEIYLCAVYSDMPSSVRILDGHYDKKEDVKEFIESLYDDGIVCLEPEIILSMLVFNEDAEQPEMIAQRFESLDELQPFIDEFETGLPIDTSPQDNASDEALSE